MRLNLDEIQPSEIHLRERTLWSLLVAHKQGRADEIPPIKVVFDSRQGQCVIWDGNTRAYALSLLGQNEIEAEVVARGAAGTEEVMRGAQACLLRGIRRISHLNPIDVLPDDRWRARPIVTYDRIKTA
jgi:hypothetical protein